MIACTQTRKSARDDPPNKTKLQNGTEIEGTHNRGVSQETVITLDSSSTDTSLTIPDVEDAIWSNLSWPSPEEADLSSFSSINRALGNDPALAFDPELSNMALPAAVSTWGHISTGKNPQPEVRASSRQVTGPSSDYQSATSTDSSSTTRESSGCQCLHTMAQRLEDASTQSSEKGLDSLLKCIAYGIRAYNEALSCNVCNICLENGLLLAMVAHRFSAVTTLVADRLCATASKHDSRRSAAELEAFDGPIVLGCYRMENTKLRVSLTMSIAEQHLAELQELLSATKDRVGIKAEAVETIANAGDVVTRNRSSIRGRLL